MSSSVVPPKPPPKPKFNSNNINNNNNSEKSNGYNHNNNINTNSHEKNHNIIESRSEENLNNIVPPPDDEKVVMTPQGKTSNSTVLLIERKLIEDVNNRVHVAGGEHKGIIINKEATQGEINLKKKKWNLINFFFNYLEQKSKKTPPQLSLEFRVFLVSANTGQHSQESRFLRFWFRPWITDVDRQATVAQDFFTKLVSPTDFPRG